MSSELRLRRVHSCACIWCSSYAISTSPERRRLCSAIIGLSAVRLCNIGGVLYVGGVSRLWMCVLPRVLVKWGQD